MAEMTATASAPASMTWLRLSRVIPPMATRGTGMSARTRLTSSGPTSSKLILLPVGNMLPTAT